MDIKEKVLAQVAELAKKGYVVTLSETYLSRIESAKDDWDFADCPDTTLITVAKDGQVAEASSIGERRVTLKEWTGIESSVVIEDWHNKLLPDAERVLFDKFGDGEEFLFGGRTYEFNQENNGWFEDSYFVDGIQDGDGCDPYHDVPMPQDVADGFERRDWFDA